MLAPHSAARNERARANAICEVARCAIADSRFADDKPARVQRTVTVARASVVAVADDIES
jgi:hypothetical protein